MRKFAALSILLAASAGAQSLPRALPLAPQTSQTLFGALETTTSAMISDRYLAVSRSNQPDPALKSGDYGMVTVRALAFGGVQHVLRTGLSNKNNTLEVTTLGPAAILIQTRKTSGTLLVERATTPSLTQPTGLPVPVTLIACEPTTSSANWQTLGPPQAKAGGWVWVQNVSANWWAEYSFVLPAPATSITIWGGSNAPGKRMLYVLDRAPIPDALKPYLTTPPEATDYFRRIKIGTIAVPLAAGPHTIRLELPNGGINLERIEVR